MLEKNAPQEDIELLEVQRQVKLLVGHGDQDFNEQLLGETHPEQIKLIVLCDVFPIVMNEPTPMIWEIVNSTRACCWLLPCAPRWFTLFRRVVVLGDMFIIVINNYVLLTKLINLLPCVLTGEIAMEVLDFVCP